MAKARWNQFIEDESIAIPSIYKIDKPDLLVITQCLHWLLLSGIMGKFGWVEGEDTPLLSTPQITLFPAE